MAGLAALPPGADGMTFQEIRFGSDEYRLECSLRDEVLRAPLGLSLQTEDLSQESGQFHFGLFEPEGRLVACVIAVPTSSTEVTIRQMAVSPSQQRKGYGEKLMKELESWLRAHGFQQVALNARTSATGFYERLGYRIVGGEFVDVTIPHVRMVRTIGQSVGRPGQAPRKDRG